MKVFSYLEKNKTLIYFTIIIVFFIAAVWYGYRGYNYYSELSPVKDNNELLGRIFSPVVLAVIRFLIVILLGIFIAMILVSIPLKRIKVMQFEVEFAEIKEVQEKQINQSHFISEMLKEHEHFVLRAMSFKTEYIPYKEVVEEILSKYEEFVEEELDINIFAQVCEHNDSFNMFNSSKHNTLAERIYKEEKEENQYIIKRKVVEGKDVLLAVKSEYDSTFYILIESNNHTFSDNDKEVLKSILEYSKIVCESVILLD